MKRAFLASLLAIVSAASFAQSPPDVPEGHWAAKAVGDLYRLGVLKGYPDGLYRGTRPATRYELAQAINGLFGVTKATTDGLQNQIDTLKARPQADVQGLADMRRRLDSLDADVQQIQALRPEIDSLTSTYQSLLDQVRALRQKVADARKGS